MALKLKGVDAIEFAVKKLEPVENQVQSWGFRKMGEAIDKSTKSTLWTQGKIRIILSQGKDGTSYASQYVAKHGDGICNTYFETDSAAQALEEVSKRGARVIAEPKREAALGGEIETASIAAMGDVRHTFVSRHGTNVFSPQFGINLEIIHQGPGMFAIDHMTCNLPAGDLDKWAEFYEKVFGFKQTRFFDIHTGRTGLLSKVMENEEGTVKIPMNEPTDKKSQIQEFIEVHNGPGVQHLAFSTGNILNTLPVLRRGGQEFLNVPDTYYEEVPTRVKGVQEDINYLKKERILVDGEKSGYLLQIFSQNVVGPFFYEVIQRCGNQGFGEGNFRALFEAIERDQERRGVL